MPDPIESPEAFAERVSRELEDGLPPPKVCTDAVVEMVRSRDRAVRREALQAVSDWCEAEAVRYDGSGPEAWSNALRNAAAYWLQRALDLAESEEPNG